MAPPEPSSREGRERAGSSVPYAPLNFLLYAVPPLSVLVVGVVLLTAGAPQPFLFARLLGGPTDLRVPPEARRGHRPGPFHFGSWSGRVQLLSREGDVDTPVAHAPLRVEWSAFGHVTSFRTMTDSEGWAEVRLDRPQPAEKLELSIYGGELGELAVRGAPELDTARWRQAARRRGGVLKASPGSAQEQLRIAVRVVDGVLAVPFECELEVDVRDGAQALAGAALEWVPQGLDVLSAPGLVTDEHGRARIRVRPREHAVFLDLTARKAVTTSGGAEQTAQGHWFSQLPVVAGALHAHIEKSELVIESPTVRDSAWYALVSQDRRLYGGRVEMHATGNGGSIGVVPQGEAGVPDRPSRDHWLVLSGDPDGRSPSTVGWPWGNQDTTFDAMDAVLLDGSRFGQQREDARRRRVRGVAGGYSALAALLTLILLVRRVRKADRELAWRLAGVGAAESVPSRGSLAWGLVVAGLCVLLGFLVVAVVSLARAR